MLLLRGIALISMRGLSCLVVVDPNPLLPSQKLLKFLELCHTPKDISRSFHQLHEEEMSPRRRKVLFAFMASIASYSRQNEMAAAPCETIIVLNFSGGGWVGWLM